MTNESEKKKQIQMIRHIAKVVSDYFGLTIYELVSKTRKRKIVGRRQIAQEISYSLIPNVTQETVGFELGRQDHASVANSIKSVNNQRDTDIKYNSDYITIYKSLANSLFPIKQKKEVSDRFKKSRNLISARSASIRHRIIIKIE